MQGLVRLLEKLRKERVAQWRAATNRSYDGATGGKRVEDTVWKQAWANEVQRERGDALELASSI